MRSAAAGTPAATSASWMARVRRSASGSARAWASAPGPAASPPATTAIAAPARRAAMPRSAASVAAGSVADPCRNTNATGGGTRGTAGALALAGKPPRRGKDGSVVGRSGNGPDSTGDPAACDTVRGPVAAGATAAAGGVAGNGMADGAAAGCTGAVAASITATDALGSGAGTGGSGAMFAPGLSFEFAFGEAVGRPPETLAAGKIKGSCVASRCVRSRSDASRDASARRVAASVTIGRAGTWPKFGYGSSTPGGGGRTSAILPPCRVCHHSIGVSRVSLLSFARSIPPHAETRITTESSVCFMMHIGKASLAHSHRGA